MDYNFDTPQPPELHLELDRGSLTVTALATDTTTVRVEGDQPERLRVDYRENRLTAVVEKRSLFDFAPRLQVWVTVPLGARVVARTGSAGIAISGAIAEASLSTGSGDVEIAQAEGLVRVQSGSGDVRIGPAGQVRVKTGSGDVSVGSSAGDLTAQTGSGDISLGQVGAVASAKTASGRIRIDQADSQVIASTASGDIEVRRVRQGEISAASVSGSIAIGVPAGVPVWTDISTFTGQLHSDLAGAGRPEAGQDHLRLRLKSVSGDVRLTQLAPADLR